MLLLPAMTATAGPAANQGPDTIGCYFDATAVVAQRAANAVGNADRSYLFGGAANGFQPVTPDTSGSFVNAAGLYDGTAGLFYLSSDNTQKQFADLQFPFGPPGNTFVAFTGNFGPTGIGETGIALYEDLGFPTGGLFHIRTTSSDGPAEITFPFGPGGADFVPIVGNWNGIGGDGVGLYQLSTGLFHLKNDLTDGGADLTIQYGPTNSGWIPVAGNWDFTGGDSIGLFDPAAGEFYLKNDNSGGAADLRFLYGPADGTCKPIIGNWQAQPPPV